MWKWIVTSSVVIIVGCQEPTMVSLDREDQQLIDSLFLSSAKTFNKVQDSICEAYKEQHYPHLRDSIEQVRLLEIQQLLEQ